MNAKMQTSYFYPFETYNCGVLQEPIEEFIAWKGAYEISSLIENDDDAPYKSETGR